MSDPFGPTSEFTPPSSTLNDDAPVISNDATAGSEVADGATASLKSTGTLMLLVASAYRASDGKKTPPSSVDDGAKVRLVAPSTDTSSRTPQGPVDRALVRSPSTS